MKRNLLAEAQFFATFGIGLATLCASATIASNTFGNGIYTTVSYLFFVGCVIALANSCVLFWKYDETKKS